MRVRLGDLIIVTGTPNSGKSDVALLDSGAHDRGEAVFDIGLHLCVYRRAMPIVDRLKEILR